MKIEKPDNCGNSPKNQFIETFILRLLSSESIDTYFEDNMIVEIAGKERTVEIEDIVREIEKYGRMEKIAISEAISHGKKGAVEVEIRTDIHKRVEVGFFITFKTLKADKVSKLKVFFGNLTSVLL